MPRNKISEKLNKSVFFESIFKVFLLTYRKSNMPNGKYKIYELS